MYAGEKSLRQDQVRTQEFMELPNKTKRSEQLYGRLQLLIVLGILVMIIYKYFTE